MLVAASDPDSREFRIVEDILKGPEVTLPEGRTFLQGGQDRSKARVRWWDTSATTYRSAAIVDARTAELLPDAPIPGDYALGYQGDKPVFFGHYWFRGAPRPAARNAVCVDYSAVRPDGSLVAAVQGNVVVCYYGTGKVVERTPLEHAPVRPYARLEMGADGLNLALVSNVGFYLYDLAERGCFGDHLSII